MAVCGDCTLVESVGVEAGMAVCGDEFLDGCRQTPHPRMFGNITSDNLIVCRRLSPKRRDFKKSFVKRLLVES